MNKNIFKQEYVLCAAIHVEDGEKHVHQPKNIESGYVVTGWRHHNCFKIINLIGSKPYNHTQGFLTSKNRFLNRQEAGALAKQCGQLNYHTDRLFSEDLY